MWKLIKFEFEYNKVFLLPLLALFPIYSLIVFNGIYFFQDFSYSLGRNFWTRWASILFVVFHKCPIAFGFPGPSPRMWWNICPTRGQAYLKYELDWNQVDGSTLRRQTLRV